MRCLSIEFRTFFVNLLTTLNMVNIFKLNNCIGFVPGHLMSFQWPKTLKPHLLTKNDQNTTRMLNTNTMIWRILMSRYHFLWWKQTSSLAQAFTTFQFYLFKIKFFLLLTHWPTLNCCINMCRTYNSRCRTCIRYQTYTVYDTLLCRTYIIPVLGEWFQNEEFLSLIQLNLFKN